MSHLKAQLSLFANSVPGKLFVNVILWISALILNSIPTLIFLAIALLLNLTFYREYAESIFSEKLILSITICLFIGTLISTMIFETFYKKMTNIVSNTPLSNIISIQLITAINSTLFTFLGTAIAFTLAISSKKVTVPIEVNFFIATISVASLSATLRIHDKFSSK